MREASQLTAGQWIGAVVLGAALAAAAIVVVAWMFTVGWNDLGFAEFLGEKTITFGQAVGGILCGLVVGAVLRGSRGA